MQTVRLHLHLKLNGGKTCHAPFVELERSAMSACNHTIFQSALRGDECAQCLREEAQSRSPEPHGSLAIPSVKILLSQMMDALDAVDSDKYWAAFEAVLKRHQEVMAEVAGPENSD